MSDRIKRFNKRKQILEKNKSSLFSTVVAPQQDVHNLLNQKIDCQRLGLLAYSTNVEVSYEVSPEEVSHLLSELKNSFNKEKREQVFGELSEEIIRTIAGPFGLGRVLSVYDKVGGNVDTVHNVRSGVYASNEEKEKYENLGEYDRSMSNKVHSDSNYVNKNRADKQSQGSAEGLKNGYSDDIITDKHNRNLDHIIAAKTTHDDPARVLAEISTEDLANEDENLVSTTETVNKSKGAKTPMEFAIWLDETKPERIKKIKELEDKKSQGTLTDKETKELKKLKEIDSVDPEEVKKHGKDAQDAQDRKINKEYYLSPKFVKKSLKTSAVEGVKMGAQQAIGVLVIEFFSSAFTEIRKAFDKGLEGENLYEYIKKSLKRIGEKLVKKWRDVIKEFTGGFISGFISNLITVVVNAFVTTGKSFVRIIREGVFSLLKALKLLIFPPENLTYKEVIHEVMKLIAAGGVLATGIVFEEVVEKFILGVPFLAPFATMITAAFVGSLTVLVVALVSYLIDKMDLLGVIKKDVDSYLSEKISEDTQKCNESMNATLEEIGCLKLS